MNKEVLMVRKNMSIISHQCAWFDWNDEVQLQHLPSDINEIVFSLDFISDYLRRMFQEKKTYHKSSNSTRQKYIGKR